MKEDLFFLGVKALIRRADGKVLVVQLKPEIRSERNPGGWDIPGGRIKQGETVEQVLTREVKEEVGLTASNFELLVMAPTPIRLKALDREVGLIFGIYTATVEDDSQVTIGDEHDNAVWVTPAEAAEKLSAVFPRELLDHLRQLS